MNEKILEKINSPEDLKNIPEENLPQLCKELREKIITVISKNGGHLASNLGVVELTVALHRIFNSPQDKIVWDVGHQTYAHKLLTGRKNKFNTIRQKDGLSGFPKPNESAHDAFIAGHSGTSISVASGIAKAKTLKNQQNTTIAVIGDGSFTCGLAYEAVNNAARNGDKLIVILNDNKMSISKNESSLAKYLSVIRSKPNYFKIKDKMKDNISNICRYIPFFGKNVADLLIKMKSIAKTVLYGSNFFEDMGFCYLGPVDGHDLEQLCSVLNRAKSLNRPVFLHIETKKGKGYPYAEENPGEFHGISGFNVETGEIKTKVGATNFSDEFGKYLTEFGKNDEKICAITAAMKYGTGLNYFSKEFKQSGRFFDVGIAESHAVAFAAGLASEGMLPVFAVYSSFLQRCYDQIIHDCSIQKQHLIFAVDRAGIVGADGETHNGLFDVAMLINIPNIAIYSPATYRELRWALKKSLYEENGVCAVRYPRGGENAELAQKSVEKDWVLMGEKSENLIVTYGRITSEVLKAAKELNTTVLKLNKIFPVEQAIIDEMKSAKRILFVEEGIKIGGLSQYLSSRLLENSYKGEIQIRAVDNRFVPHATVDEATELCGLDAKSLIRDYRDFFEK